MKFKIKTKENISKALDYIQNYLKKYDTSILSHITISSNSTWVMRDITGFCFIPDKKSQDFYINCRIFPPYPIKTLLMETIDSPIITLKNANEALIFIAFHEIHHFLTYSKQFKGYDDERAADLHSLRHLTKFRNLTKRK